MQLRSQRGSVLIATFIFIIILSAAAFSVLGLSTSSYRLSMKNQLQAEAHSIAESEMEFLYFRFKGEVMASSGAAAGVPGTLETLAISDNSATPTTARTPFLQAHASAGWTVRRSLILDRKLASERIPGTTKEGSFTYLVARIEVIPPASHTLGTVATVRIGRRFMNSNSPIFQYAIFYEGTLEFNPGGAGLTTVDGDVVANGSIYIGPINGGTMQLNGKVRYLKDNFFNVDSSANATFYNPIIGTTPTGVFPVFGTTGTTSPGSQLEVLDEPENLLGGIDVPATAVSAPLLFGPSGRADPSAWDATDSAIAQNNVYRSMIVPPPSVATTGSATSEFPNVTSATSDNPAIGVVRAYRNADLILTVTAAGVPTFQKRDHDNGDALVDVTSKFIGCLTDFVAPATPADYTYNLWDERENTNVQLVELDVGALKTIITTLRAASAPDHFDFHGELYVHLMGAVPGTLAAIRLKNAANLPYNELVDNSLGLSGFSVATNGGIYVQGSYNTSTPLRTVNEPSPRTGIAGDPVFPKSDLTAGHVPAMLLADAITLLSLQWADSTSTRALTSRIADSSPTANPGTYPRTYLNAGLLTGNNPSTAGQKSGGAQNLVRYMENWSPYNGGHSLAVTFEGSIGRLFKPTKFVSNYVDAGTVYFQPTRTFTFDRNILLYPPPGSPTTTSFSRGTFFTW